MADCSNSNLTQIPSSLPKDLDWLLLSGNNISFLDCKTVNNQILTHISKLNKSKLKQNRINNISSKVLDIFVQSSSLDILDLSFNDLSFIPKNIRNITSLKSLNILGNKFKCTCDNMWMKDWILDNDNIVQNYKDIKCKMKGQKWFQIVQMNEVDMGCFPNGSFAVWKILGQIMIFRLKLTNKLLIIICSLYFL